MTGQFLCLWERGAVPQKLRDVGVATGSMEVGNPILCAVWDASALQVFLNHFGQFLSLQSRKKLLARQKALQPITQHLH